MKREIFLFYLTICFTACVDFGASTPSVKFASLIPGDCLDSTDLTYYVSNASGRIFNGLFRFNFALDIGGCTQEKLAPLQYRYAPSDETYKLFAPNSTAVKNEYDKIYWEARDGFNHKNKGPRFSIATLLYCGGISLTADKDFAGYPVGTDLGPLLKGLYTYDVQGKEIEGSVNTVISEPFTSKDNAGSFIDLPLDYISLTHAHIIEFGFPVGDCSLTDEHVTFDLEIPVKVVMYLHWLNDKLSDPNAPVPYKEEVLHCHFTVENGLKKPS